MGVLDDDMIDYAARLDVKSLQTSVIHQAKRRVIDTVASSLAAFWEPAVQIAHRMAVPTAGPLRSRVWGSLAETSCEQAAFVNGCMLRYLDLNDTYGSPGGIHPSDCVGGNLAVAEALHKSGLEFLQAVIISYEIQCRLADSMALTPLGWDQGVLLGQIANALSISRLLGLSHPQMRNALALAVVPNLPTFQSRTGELSMWKGCAGANGVRHSIFSAMLASEGMEGPDEPLDGKFGFWRMTARQRLDVGPFATSLNGARFGITQSFIKSYPVRYSIQLAIDTALDLRAKVVVGDIASLRIETPRSENDSFSNPELWTPSTRETADHSMPVTVAMALLDGELTPDSFATGRFKAPDVQHLVGRTAIEGSDEFTRAAQASTVPARRHCRITATMNDGRTHQSHLSVDDEDLMHGPSDKEMEAKFERLTRSVMSYEKRDELLGHLWRLDVVNDVADVVSRIVIA
jgi:2-methylcitrate dehydratase